MEDKAMIEEDKRILANRLEEKSTELTKIYNMKLDTLIQMMNSNYELNVKDIEITTLKLQNEQLQNDLKREKEIAIQENEAQYKGIDTTKVFANGNSNEFDVAVADLMKKNRAQAEKIRKLKLEQESQAIFLRDVTK